TGAVTQQMKDDIRTKEIIRFKELVGTNAAKEVDAIIAGSPRPEAYAEALDRLKYRIGDIDTYSTTSVINKLEEDTKKLAKEEAIEKAKQEGKSEEEQKEAGEAAETNAKVGYESMQYVELLRKKTELEQKLKEERSKVAGIDEEIKAHKEAEATIDEKKEQYIDKKRSWLLKGLKAVGYASLAGGWLGAMSGLTGVGVGVISGLTGVTDIGFFKGLGLGATWLFNVAYKEMALLERFYGIGKVSQLMVAALTLVPLDFLWKKNLKNKSQKEYDQKKEALEKKKSDQLDELKIKQMESQLSEAKLGLEKYKKLNQERVKLLQGQKKHYEKIQDDLMKQVDANRKKGEAIGDLQTKLDLVSKTVLSLESFLTLFSVSEGDRAERVLGLSVVSPENILANIQAMEDKLEPQLSQNLLQL